MPVERASNGPEPERPSRAADVPATARGHLRRRLRATLDDTSEPSGYNEGPASGWDAAARKPARSREESIADGDRCAAAGDFDAAIRAYELARAVDRLLLVGDLLHAASDSFEQQGDLRTVGHANQAVQAYLLVINHAKDTSLVLRARKKLEKCGDLLVLHGFAHEAITAYGGANSFKKLTALGARILAEGGEAHEALRAFECAGDSQVVSRCVRAMTRGHGARRSQD